MKSILVHECGPADNMKLEDVATPKPGAGQALVRITASGVNFIDVYFRMGLYKADLPVTLGMEAAGTVEAVGPDVTDLAVGDRVAYAMQRGSYAEFAVVPAWQLVKVPAELDLKVAAASMLQGMTAHYLTQTIFPLKQGDVALVHAAAGGAGLLTVQMAKMRGATVIGTCSTEEKAEKARAAGCDHVILYTSQNFSQESRRITDGRGVDVVFDSVGATTWEGSLDSLRPRGMMVSFGNASGAVPPFAPLVLSAKGSLFLTRPTLANYVANRDELAWRAGDVLSWVASGKVKLHIDRTYPLAEAPQAHKDLEGRKTMGKVLLEVGA